MDFGLTGRVAVVTGASGGLGRGSAMALADEGVKVILSARTLEPLRATADELRSRGAMVDYLAADVGDEDTPSRLVALALERFGRIDIVVANAGGPPRLRALEFDEAQLRQAMNNNFLSVIRFTKAALPYLAAQQWGRICAIASTSVARPIPTIALSNAARSALWAWAKTAAQDVATSGVTLNLVCPGRHRTSRMNDRPERPDDGGRAEGLIGDAGDFGKVVAFYCSEAAKFVNGAAILVDGGSTLAL